MRILTTFRDIAASTTETPPAYYLKQILMRQLAMKDNTSTSWTAQLKRTLAKYGLPSASEILETQPRKQYWGQLVKDAILRHWTDKLQDEAQQMSTLAYPKLDASDLGKLHSTWLELHNKLDIERRPSKHSSWCRDTHCLAIIQLVRGSRHNVFCATSVKRLPPTSSSTAQLSTRQDNYTYRAS